MSVRDGATTIPSTMLSAAITGSVRRGERGYPEVLEHLTDPPELLHWAGSREVLGAAPAVAIVGARAASEAGREIATALAHQLAVGGCVIVSGLARGIDGAAHEGALEAGGATVAVLGNGLDVVYPAEHARLQARIRERGCIVTEYEAGVEPRRAHFPQRNRILAALAHVVIVVEGGEKSGARSTVDHALDLGREVLAVPRDILHEGSALPNRLLRDGARPVLSAADVLEALPDWAIRRDGPESADRALLDLLRGGPRALAEIAAAHPEWDVPTLLRRLVRLELLGRVRRSCDTFALAG